VPTVLEVTNPELALVRFHGRNAKTWYKKVERTADRFDYLYSEDELREWVPNLAHLTEQGLKAPFEGGGKAPSAEGAQELHVFFNNNRDDYAVRNARQLTQLLQGTLPGVVTPAQP